MKNSFSRRDFLKTTTVAVAGFGLSEYNSFSHEGHKQQGSRIGIIGLDTSHSVAFATALNNPDAGSEFGGFRVVAAYPRGSSDIKSSVDRIPGYTEEVKKLGVIIVNSLDELIDSCDCILLETNDGRLHLEQAIPVLKAGKRMFIDKPVAASLSDAIAIFRFSEYYKVPVFSSSSLRYISGMKEIKEGSIGKVLGADVFSPATIEKTHPDLFWYGVHGVETLFTAMGTGCKSVVRTSSQETDVVTGKWNDERIGTFRGIRSGKADYGGTVFGEKAIAVLGKYNGYNPLLLEIVKYFQTGIVPVTAEETIEIFAFMEAAEESKLKNGEPVMIDSVMHKAEKKIKSIT